MPVTLAVEKHSRKRNSEQHDVWLCAIDGSNAVRLAKFVDFKTAEIFKEALAAACAVAFAQGQMGI